MTMYLRSALGGALLLSASLAASAAATDYFFVSDPNYAGIDVSTITGDTIQPVAGSPFAVNPFLSGSAETPFEFSVAADTLYAVYYGESNGQAGLASFNVQNGVPQLISSIFGIGYEGPYGPAGLYPLMIGARFVILPTTYPLGGTSVYFFPSSNGTLKDPSVYRLGSSSNFVDGLDTIGVPAPSSTKTDASQHYLYVTYDNPNPQTTGIWKATLAKGATGTLTVSNVNAGLFEYQVVSAGCTQTVSGNLTETGTQVSGTGSYSQSGSACTTLNADATLTGTVSGQQLTLTTASTAGNWTIAWQKVISRANNASLYGACGASFCLAVYDISRVPSSGPLLLQTSAMTPDQSIGVVPSGQ